MVGEVSSVSTGMTGSLVSLDDIGVKAENAELVSAHHSREELHDEHLVFQRELFI